MPRTYLPVSERPSRLPHFAQDGLRGCVQFREILSLALIMENICGKYLK